MKKPFVLERKIKPECFGFFYKKLYGYDWRRVGRYATLENVLNAHAKLMKTAWDRDFEYRIETPVGFVTPPVVKS